MPKQSMREPSFHSSATGSVHQHQLVSKVQIKLCLPLDVMQPASLCSGVGGPGSASLLLKFGAWRLVCTATMSNTCTGALGNFATTDLLISHKQDSGRNLETRNIIASFSANPRLIRCLVPHGRAS